MTEKNSRMPYRFFAKDRHCGSLVVIFGLLQYHTVIITSTYISIGALSACQSVPVGHLEESILHMRGWNIPTSIDSCHGIIRNTDIETDIARLRQIELCRIERLRRNLHVQNISTKSILRHG